jgi:hypothetical protein
MAENSDAPVVLYERRQSTALITLNRPGRDVHVSYDRFQGWSTSPTRGCSGGPATSSRRA